MRMELTGNFTGYEKMRMVDDVSSKRAMGSVLPGTKKANKMWEQISGTIGCESLEKEREERQTPEEQKLSAKKMPSGIYDGKNSQTTSDIVVKPDGSRVLVMTVNIGGMKTTVSLEISKPTDLPNGRGAECGDDPGTECGNREAAGKLAADIDGMTDSE